MCQNKNIILKESHSGRFKTFNLQDDFFSLLYLQLDFLTVAYIKVANLARLAISVC